MKKRCTSPSSKRCDDHRMGHVFGGKDERFQKDDFVHVVHMHDSISNDQRLVMKNCTTKQMNAHSFQKTLKEATSLSQSAKIQKCKGNTKESFDSFREALQLYSACYTYYTNCYLKFENVKKDRDKSGEENFPPISLE